MNKSKFIFLGIILVIIIAIPFILNYKYEKRIEYAKNINSFNASVSHSSCEDLYYDIGTSIDIICSALLNADIDITQSKKIFTYNEHCLLEKTDSTNVLWNIPKMKTVLKNASICPDEIF